MPYLRDDYLALPGREYTWLWDGLVPAGGRALLFGEPKRGKSYLALGLAESIADPNAPTYLEQPIGAHGPVLYVQLDTPRELWRQNYVRRTRPESEVWYLDREDPDLPPEFDIRRVDHGAWFAEQVEAVEPVLVVVDTLREIHQGDENDSTTMQQVLSALSRAVGSAATLLLAHDNKPMARDTRSSVARIRGSSYVAGAVDAVLYLTRKGLKVAARSPIISVPAQQQGDGFFFNMAEVMHRLPPDLPAREKDALIARILNVSDRTARRYRLAFEEEQGE